MKYSVCTLAVLALASLAVSPAPAAPKDGMKWHKEIRAALEEAEDRGVCLMIYLTRDD